MEYFIVQYFYWSEGCRMNHSFETFKCSYNTLSEVKALVEEVIANNRDIHGYYITKQEILETSI